MQSEISHRLEQREICELANAVSQMDLASIRKRAIEGQLSSINDALVEKASALKFVHDQGFVARSASILFHHRSFCTLLSLYGCFSGDIAIIHYYVAVAHMLSGHFIEASLHIERAMTLQPKNPEFLRTKFFVALFFGRTNDARAVIATADQFDRGDLTAALDHYPGSCSVHAALESTGTTLSRAWLNERLEANDFVRPYIALLYYYKKLRRVNEKPEEFHNLFLYCLIRLNRRFDLVTEVHSCPNEREAIAWVAILSYIDRVDKRHNDVVRRAQGLVPSKCEAPSVFYSLAFECLCECLLELNMKTEFAAVVDEDIALNGLKPWNSLYAGLRRFEIGDPGYRAYWQNAGRSNTFSLNHSWGVNSYAGTGASTFNDDMYKYSLQTKIQETECVVLMSCDMSYFQLFRRNLLEDVAKTTKVIWHVHFVIDGWERPTLEELRVAFPNLSLSAEYHQHKMPKAYYTMARFVVAPSVMLAYCHPLVIIDIDFKLLSEELLIILVKNSEFDVLLEYAPYYLHFPWHAIQASSSLFLNKEKSLAFLGHVRQWFESNFDQRHNYQWWIDQVALKEAEMASKNIVRFGNIMTDIHRVFTFAASNLAAKKKMALGTLE